MQRPVSVGLEFFDLQKASVQIDGAGVQPDMIEDPHYFQIPENLIKEGDLDFAATLDVQTLGDFIKLANIFISLDSELKNLNNIQLEKHRALLNKDIICAAHSPRSDRPNFTQGEYRGVKYSCNTDALETHAGFHAGEVDDHEDEETFNQIEDAIREEQYRLEEAWVENLFLFEPGYAAIAICFFIEKALKKCCEACIELGISDKRIKRNSSISIVEARIKFLREDVGLNIQFTPEQAEFLLNVRTNRNAFVHGDWNDICFGEIKASDMIRFAYLLLKNLDYSMRDKFLSLRSFEA